MDGWLWVGGQKIEDMWGSIGTYDALFLGSSALVNVAQILTDGTYLPYLCTEVK